MTIDEAVVALEAYIDAAVVTLEAYIDAGDSTIMTLINARTDSVLASNVENRNIVNTHTDTQSEAIKDNTHQEILTGIPVSEETVVELKERTQHQERRYQS